MGRPMTDDVIAKAKSVGGTITDDGDFGVWLEQEQLRAFYKLAQDELRNELMDLWDDLLEDLELHGMHDFEPYIKSKKSFNEIAEKTNYWQGLASTKRKGE
jgi:hypothetical protein